MATHGDIERTIEIINTRTRDINIILNHWNQNQNDDTYRQDFNTITDDILTLFEEIVDIIDQTPEDVYVTLASDLYRNLQWLLSNIDNMLGDPNDVNDPRHQLRSEIGLLDKTQRMTIMMNILDAYIIRHSPREVIPPPPPPSSGGFRRYKNMRKIIKNRKTRKSKRKGRKTKRLR